MRSEAATWLLAAALLSCLAPSSVQAAEPERVPPDFRAQVGDALVRPGEARMARWQWQRPPALLVLYFGAGWCGPCHAFVPTLRDVYAELRAAGVDTEVVFVSLDESERDMRRYMRRQSMPWPAIDHRRLQAMPAVRRLGGIAPPNLVVIAPDGTVLANGWDGNRYAGLAPVLETWLAAARSSTREPMHPPPSARPGLHPR
ncbi:thioredoxin-like domain-containing protein [Luteimonas sp. FCS-9]|uniref:thioredoxin-like domain-containing protein n=1 Tax=Luteimonas sp. FCS-9 TaxID=1547516 RepID=UPI00063E9A4B|nr:thioredoxin-like domain-containing protein [Luteimonas sp. FCS-9]KLJ00763.1 hypothetical protein WQ56_08210 [Luteimonas sp. FCS-9]